jgi:hypothetical protein
METGSNKRKQLEAPFEAVVKKQRLMAETTETVDRWLAECNKYKMMFSNGNHSKLTHSLCHFVFGLTFHLENFYCSLLSPEYFTIFFIKEFHKVLKSFSKFVFMKLGLEVTHVVETYCF